MSKIDALWTRARFGWATARGCFARLVTDAALRERTLANATFTAIFAFGVVAFDQILTGGADWSVDAGQAYAMAPASPLGVAAPEPQDSSIALEHEASPAYEAIEVDYSYTTETLLGGPDDPTAPDGYHRKLLDLAQEATALIAPLKPSVF